MPQSPKQLTNLLQILIYKANIRIYRLLHGKPQSYLKSVKGVIHIGASTGQERTYYSEININVLWIEAIPKIYQDLLLNIQSLPKQRAFNYLVDRSNQDNSFFNISSNSGESSSLLALEDHQTMYPDVAFVDSIQLNARSLDWIIETEGIDLDMYDSLILDVQGAELRVLKGAVTVIPKMRYIEVEVADFRAYNSCPILSEMTQFMYANGFLLDYLQSVSFSPGVGTYYNATYKNKYA